MSGDARRALRPGGKIALGQDVYTVIQLNGTTVTLQDQDGELSAFLLGYLLAEPDFEALEVAPRRVPQDARLATLDEAEQDRVRWLEGHILELESGRHPVRPAREAYDPDLHSVDEREKAKLAELDQAGFAMTQRSLKRLRSAYLEEGLLGLADKRKLRRCEHERRRWAGWLMAGSLTAVLYEEMKVAWPFGAALRREASNHPPLHWLKTVVANGAGKVGTGSRQV